MSKGFQGVTVPTALDLLSLFHANGLRAPNFSRFGPKERIVECLTLIDQKVSTEDTEWAEKEALEASIKGVKLVALGDSDYPRRLIQIEDPPLVTFLNGTLPAEETPVVAIVGTRNATRSGAAFARKIARMITSAGGVVISGLALGVDGAAHLGAIEAISFDSANQSSLKKRHPGIAVLGAGMNYVTPLTHIDIHDSLLRLGGAVISEFGMNVHPTKFTFPQRNRIISGMADCVIVIEAKERSGALITARTALEQGREVLVVPGSPLNPACAGSNRLLRDGATPLVDAEDLFIYLPALSRLPVKERLERAQSDINNLDSESRAIMDILGQRHALTFDQIVEAADIPAEKLAAKLSELELDGAIYLHPGSIFSISPFLE